MHNAGNFNSRLYFDDGVLYLNLSGGEVCPKLKKKRETIIQFVCNSSLGSSDPGKPVYISENDCTYYIVWHTSLVCERQVCTKHLRLETKFKQLWNLSLNTNSGLNGIRIHDLYDAGAVL